MSNEGMRKSMIAGGVLMRGVLRISLVLYPLVCVETPALALNCEFDRKTAACLLDIVPAPRSYKPFTFQLQLKSKEFFGIRKEVDPLTGATREYLEQGGSSSPSIWDPVFEIVDWEVWARTPTGFLPVASGVGSSGTVTVTHGGSFILHVRTKRTGVEKHHVRLPDGGAEEIEVPAEVLFGTEHHEFQVAAWCVDATVNIQAPLDTPSGQTVLPIGVPVSSPDLHLVKMMVGGPPPPVPANVVFYIEEEGGGHESDHHTPFRPTGTLLGRMVQTVPYPTTAPMVYRAGQFSGSGRVSIAISEEALPAATGPTPPEQYAHRDAVVDASSQIAARGKWCEMGSAEFEIKVPNLVEIPDPQPLNIALDELLDLIDDLISLGIDEIPIIGPIVAVLHDLTALAHWVTNSYALGRTAGHPNNNWATADDRIKTKLIALMVFDNFYRSVVDSSGPGLKPEITDISLKDGGLLDENHNWKKRHARHDIGREFDVANIEVPPFFPFAPIGRYFVFKTMVMSMGGSMSQENVRGKEVLHVSF